MLCTVVRTVSRAGVADAGSAVGSAVDRAVGSAVDSIFQVVNKIPKFLRILDI